MVNCDYDHLVLLVNRLRELRQLLGHGNWDPTHYSRQTLHDNVSLLSPVLLMELNDLVVGEGHEASGKKKGETLVGRCDTKVVENDTEFPTDIGMLFSSGECLIRVCAKLANLLGFSGWSQAKSLTKKLRAAFQLVRTSQKYKSNPQGVRDFLDMCGQRGDKAEEFLQELIALEQQLQKRTETRLLSKKEAKMLERLSNEIPRIVKYLGYLTLLADQVERRILQGEKISPDEKIFSIHKPFTRWIVKGKAGTVCELGVPVAIVEDQYQFVLGYGILWEGTDQDIAAPLIKAVQKRYPEFQVCSFDRGFYSPKVRQELDQLLITNAMPRKGRLTKADRIRQSDPAFKAARKQHARVEAKLNHLNHHGWDRVREKSKEGFERVVATAILATNLLRLGRLIREQKLREAKRRRRRAA